MGPRHYPLNGVDLDFDRYAHRPLSGRDIFVSRIMDDLFNPRRVSPRTYLREVRRPPGFEMAKSEDRQLGLDLQVMWRLLQMDWPGPARVSFQEAIIELVQMHYFHRDPLIYQAIRTVNHVDRNPKSAPRWKRDMIAHLALFQSALQVRHRFSVFSGSSRLPFDNGPWNGRLTLGPCFVAVAWTKYGPRWPRTLRKESKRSGYLTLPYPGAVHHAVPERSQSLPAPDRWGLAAHKYEPAIEGEIPYVAFFPRRPLSELARLSRRRSLSRSHIRDMFTDKPRWIVADEADENADADADAGPGRRPPCSNCGQRAHAARRCPSACGYCNSYGHKARACAVKRENRCKCAPFPQFHRASACRVTCSRRCGAPHPPGSHGHRNAMTCAHRCCMCGLPGHSGARCALRRCRCGGQHLTQDCRWKVECRAPGCSYYLCPLHCRECGVKRTAGEEGAFVGRTCRSCLANGVSMSPRAP
ncbi:hypothetical protein F4802DRAFT_308785 [Xylaria palmicola]|nr:hypothetical protein F4802DRAFT_308785 [Xylaria palmicola]